MEVLQAILDVVKPDPWLAVAIVLFMATSGTIYRYYAATLSERGPGARRVRQNLEKDRTFLREQYYYVLLSIKRTLDELFGPPRSKIALVDSFSFFMKVSAQYSIGTLLLVYLLSGVSPAVFNVFSNALSRNERGSLAICSILGVCFAAVFYFESDRGVIAVARSTFFGIAPFFLVEGAAQVLHYDTYTNSITYWFYLIFFTSFVACFFTAINQSGFVAFTVLISFPLALFSQLALVAAIPTWMGLEPEDFLKHDFWSVVKGMLFSFEMMCVLVATSLFPFLIQFLAGRFEAAGLKLMGKGKFYVAVALAGFVLFFCLV